MERHYAGRSLTQGRIQLPLPGTPPDVQTFQDLVRLVRGHEQAMAKPSYKRFFLPLSEVLEENFGSYDLDQVTPFAVEQLKIQLLREGRKGSTVNRYLAVLKKIFNVAIRWDLVQTNPVSRVEFFREGPGRSVHLDPDDQEKLLSAVPGYVRPAVELALRIGMRKGDLLALTFADVDQVNGQIMIRDQKTQSIRLVPTTGIEQLVGALCRRAAAEKDLGVNPTGFLFLSRNYERFGPAGFAREFQAAAKKCGFLDLRWHDLRHCCASDLVNSGASLPVVAKVLGHKDVKTSARYAHLETASIREAFKARGKFLVAKSGAAAV